MFSGIFVLLFCFSALLPILINFIANSYIYQWWIYSICTYKITWIMNYIKSVNILAVFCLCVFPFSGLVCVQVFVVAVFRISHLLSAQLLCHYFYSHLATFEAPNLFPQKMKYTSYGYTLIQLLIVFYYMTEREGETIWLLLV